MRVVEIIGTEDFYEMQVHLKTFEYNGKAHFSVIKFKTFIYSKLITHKVKHFRPLPSLAWPTNSQTQQYTS